MAAAVTRRLRLGELIEEHARKLVAAWTRAIVQGAVTLIPAQDDFDEAVDLALRVRHPLRDCFYLAAARRLGVPLVTAVRTFANRARAVHPATQDLRGEVDGR